MSEFKEIVGIVAYGIEAFGVLVIVIGFVAATLGVIPQLKSASPLDTYQKYRQVVGRSILLGLIPAAGAGSLLPAAGKLRRGGCSLLYR